MTNSKSTKRALVSSALAMFMSVAMLIGITFAWFTDTASTAVNKIQSGNLDVALEMSTDGSTWESAEGKTLTFKTKDADQILWEPGSTYELPQLRVVNIGNLALKYKIQITGIQGDAKLNEVIDWTINDAAINLTEGHLTAGQTGDAFTIKGHMQETAGNDYHNLTIDGIGITVVATQYDATAKYPVINSAELVAAIADADAGSVVNLVPGKFLLSASQKIGEGVTIAGNGPSTTTITTSTTPSGTKNTGLVIDNKNVTIKDTKIDGSFDITSNEYYGVIDIREGGTTLDNVSISRSLSNASCVVIKNGVDSGETVTLKNSTFEGGFKTINIVDGANGTVVIDNCEITGMYTFNVNSASSQDLTIKVSDSKLHGWTSYGKIKEAIFENTEFSKGNSAYDFFRPYADTTLTDCTFDSEFLMGSGNTGFTITLNNCVKNGVAVTADNVQSLLLDMTGEDGGNLSGCIIIVNGVNVTLS